MMKDQGLLDRILVRFVGREPKDVPLTDEENLLLQQWLQMGESNRRRFERICNGEEYITLWEEKEIAKSRVRKKLMQQIQPGRRVVPLSRWKVVAAAITVLAVASLLFLMSRNSAPSAVVEDVTTDQIMPGGQVATLTLGNGQTIALDQQTGRIATQGQVVIENDSSGQLAYSATRDESQRNVFNTMKTPTGGQYRISLPDGTKVWLNAASSLKFPASFGDQRQVFLEGEGYFEVAKDARRPFIVSVGTTAGSMDVQVLGTHFNVNAYQEQTAVKTTLLEGSVLVKKGDQVQKLSPGMQSAAPWGSEPITAYQYADYKQMVSWKDGFFYFDLADINYVAQELARWYKLDVKVKEGYHEQFSARISKNESLDAVLQIIRASKIDVELQGRTLVIGK